jgi:hypothetical protein
MVEQMLSDYILKRQMRINQWTSELDFLKSIKVPLIIAKGYEDINNPKSKGEFELYSADYTLATGFRIERRRNENSSYSHYEGGLYKYRYEFYPQFYFTLRQDAKNINVLIQHRSFEKCIDMVIGCVHATLGTGDYTHESKVEEKYVDVTKALSFFKRKGVPDKLMLSLKKRTESFNVLSEYYKRDGR